MQPGSTSRTTQERHDVGVPWAPGPAAHLADPARLIGEIVQQSPVVTFVWELAPGWPVRFVSDNVERLLGVPADRLLSGELEFVELIHPDDHDRVRAEVRFHLENRHEQFAQDYRVVDGRGASRWIRDWTFVDFSDGTPSHVTGIIIDISSQMSAEQLSRIYLETTDSVFVVIDRSGAVIDANERAAEIVGRSRDALIGLNWIDTHVSESSRPELRQHLQALADTKPNGVLTWSGQIESAGGTVFDIDWQHTATFDDTGELEAVIAFGTDATERHQLDTTLRQIAETLPGALFKYSIAADDSHHIEFMSRGCEQIWEVTADQIQDDPSMLWSMIHPDDLDDMVDSVAESARSLTEWRHEWRVRTPSGREKWLRSTGTPERDSSGGTNWTTVILDITDTKEAELSAARAFDATIEVLASVIETRDPYTAGHQRHVADISVQIGEELGLDEDRLEGLHLAASIHDVGKIAIPAEILSKPSRLTTAEYTLVKQHSEIGSKLLSSIDFRWPIADIVEQHHERWNGSGYPHGIAGDDIILESRIIGVADTLEAMSTHRPYRPGLGLATAVAELQTQAGVLYDREVVAACIRLVESGAIELD